MTPVAAAGSIGGQLERDRLERRAWRIEGVVAALRARASEHGARDRVPAPLLRAIEDFQRELALIRDRLAAPELRR